MDNVRVFRLLEYKGPRDLVEKTIARSIHGTRANGGIEITAITIHEHAEVVIAPAAHETYCLGCGARHPIGPCVTSPIDHVYSTDVPRPAR